MLDKAWGEDSEKKQISFLRNLLSLYPLIKFLPLQRLRQALFMAKLY